MDQYPPAERKYLHLSEYNHALFQNMMNFMDIVWEINMGSHTAVVLADRASPRLNGTEQDYDALFSDYARNCIRESDRLTFRRNLSFDRLQGLSQEFSFDLHMRAASGAFELYRVVLTPSFDAAGALGYVYLCARNVHSEIYRIQTEFQAQQHFRDALITDSYFHFSFDATAGGLIYEDFVAKDGSRPIQTISGMDLPVPFDVFAEKWYARYRAGTKDAPLADPFTLDYLKRAYARGSRLLETDYTHRTEDGRAIPMRLYFVLIENPENQHLYVTGICHGLSFARQTAAANTARQVASGVPQRTISQEEQYRIASLHDALLVFNINLTKNLIEDEFYEIVDGKRYPILQLVGLEAPCSFDVFCERWKQVKIPTDSQEYFSRQFNRQRFLDAYAQGQKLLEMEFDTSAGRGIPITLRQTILLFPDPQTGDLLAMVSGKDVSAQRADERKQREALREAYQAASGANAAKSAFLARMSHDIRTPMNAIMGMTAIAKTHLDDIDRVADCLDKIDSSSKQLLLLINEVLDITKLESGKIGLQEEAFALPDLVDNLLALSKPQIQARHHTFTVSTHDILHEEVIGDSQRIQQVFMNIMSNAINFTPNGGSIQLDIAEKPVNRPFVGCYVFTFTDNGIGMSPDFLAHLFEPFARAQDDRAEKLQGTGLGMPIVKNIIEMMNGSIDVQSQWNQGTTVTITLYLQLPGAAEPEDPAAFTGLPVLVVDDDQASCEVACAMLAELGMEAEWASSGQEALARVTARHEKGEDYYAALLDWKMPEMDGLATAKALHKAVGDATALVFVSGYDWSSIQQEAAAVGVSDFLSKPLFKSRLIHLFQSLRERGRAGALQPSPIESLAKADFSGHRVLMAEDNEINAEIAIEILGMVGLEVDWVQNGQEAVDAIAAAEDGKYDLVFMDIQMPVMNGFEAAKAIRAMDRDYAKHIPILAMSANAFAEDVMNSKSAGMNDHLSKPLDFTHLKRALHQWLK